MKGTLATLLSIVTVVVILGELLLVAFFPLEVIYTQAWYGQLEGESKARAGAFMGQTLCWAVFPLAARNALGLALVWWLVLRANKEPSP